jgi:hypothetical protein
VLSEQGCVRGSQQQLAGNLVVADLLLAAAVAAADGEAV